MWCNKVVKRNGLGWVKVFLIPVFIGAFIGLPSHIYAKDVSRTVFSESFVDGMTLPAYKPLEISGLAPQGRTLDVKLVLNNATVTMARVTVKSDNNWHVSLNAQSPGGPYQLKIIDQKHTEVVNDIYIGRKDDKIPNPEVGIILSAALSDNMHLQPDEEINVSGLAEPGISLDVKLIKDQKTFSMARVQVARDGQWRVTMPGQSAGGPFQLYVTDGTDRKEINGIIIGRADIKKAASNPIKNEFLGLEFDDSSWPLVNLTSLEKLPKNETLLARKHMNFVIAPRAVSFNLGENHQVKQIYINGKLLDDKNWHNNSLKIEAHSSMFQSGVNVIALLSEKQWDNTRFIGTTGRFTITINNHDLDLRSNWRVFESSYKAL